MYKYNYGPQAMEYLMSRLILPSIFSSLIFSSLAVNAAELNVYGVAHRSADQLDDGQESSQYLASNCSRLGFNGHYQINTNLKAIVQYDANNGFQWWSSPSGRKSALVRLAKKLGAPASAFKPKATKKTIKRKTPAKKKTTKRKSPTKKKTTKRKTTKRKR